VRKGASKGNLLEQMIVINGVENSAGIVGNRAKHGKGNGLLADEAKKLLGKL